MDSSDLPRPDDEILFSSVENTVSPDLIRLVEDEHGRYHLQESKSQQWNTYNLDGDDRHEWFKTEPLLYSMDGMEFRFAWNDQGWGNRKGRLYVALIRDGTAVAWKCLQKGVAPHHEEKLSIHITDDDVCTESLPGDQLAIYFHVGGGGGHELFVKDFDVFIDYGSGVVLK